MYRFFYLVIILVLIQCNEAKDTSKAQIEHNDNEPLESLKDTLVIIDSISEIRLTDKPLVCNCSYERKEYSKTASLRISGLYNKKLDMNQWSDSIKLTIKSLELDHFDTIPSELAQFKNVEELIIGYIDWDQMIGMDIFPKLIKVEFWGKQIDLSTVPKWLKKVEIIEARKSKFIGLKSFKSLPNLKRINLEFSGFDKFPDDFESMKCLHEFRSGAYMGKIDLSKIDLSKMPCLNYVQFHTWRKNISGLPIGIDSVKEVHILHDNLTKQEKDKYK